MISTITQRLLEAADITAISQLVMIECESRDLGRWDRMRRCFHPDSAVRLSWFTGSGPDFVAGSIDMARRKVLATHRLGPIIVRVAGDRAVASLTAIIDIPAQLSGIKVQLSSHARFLYRTERRDQEWRILSFDAIYIRDEFSIAVPGIQVPVRESMVAGFRDSYRMLSYLLSTQGCEVNSDLPGEDRPESAAALYQELYQWAGISI